MCQANHPAALHVISTDRPLWHKLAEKSELYRASFNYIMLARNNTQQPHHNIPSRYPSIPHAGGAPLRLRWKKSLGCSNLKRLVGHLEYEGEAGGVWGVGEGCFMFRFPLLILLSFSFSFSFYFPFGISFTFSFVAVFAVRGSSTHTPSHCGSNTGTNGRAVNLSRPHPSPPQHHVLDLLPISHPEQQRVLHTAHQRGVMKICSVADGRYRWVTRA